MCGWWSTVLRESNLEISWLPPLSAGVPITKVGEASTKLFLKEGAVLLVQGCSVAEAPLISQAARGSRPDFDREDRDVRAF